ncbi:ANL_collapsed_G0053670.mRNA.1.CDS.1 [Saccharomyces cerevisiae]|nr:ANL_collapsed_G0053670.mRNA.1.CDS.1 [Saccharomyces cerevisiae]
MDRDISYQQNYTSTGATATSSRQPSTDNNADTNFLKVHPLPPAVTRTDTSETLDDINVQPSSVLQFGNSLPSEFLVASPEQFKEFCWTLRPPISISFSQNSGKDTTSICNRF